MSVFALSLVSVACGSGGGGGGGANGGLALSTFQPTALFSHEDGAVRVLGTGLGAWQDDAVIRLTAASGTPFNGGTSATVEFPATVDSSQQMRGMLPATFVTSTVDAFVTVITASGAEFTTDSAVAQIVAQRIDSITPSLTEGSDPSGVLDPIPFTITGVGFGPVGSSITVSFRDPTGQRFRGGAAVKVTSSALIENAVTISGRLPIAQVSETMMAIVEYQNESGNTVSSGTPIITFEPTPSFLSISPSIVYDGTTPSFTVTGTRLPVSNALLTFTATTGTPFNGGTSRTLSTQGVGISESEITGLMPDAGGITEIVEASVLVSIGGIFVSSGTEAVVRFYPRPTIDSATPDPVPSGTPSPIRRAGASVDLTVSGSNLLEGAIVDLLFTADGGATPFNEGTTATTSTTGVVTDADTIQVMNWPDVLLDESSIATGATVGASLTIGLPEYDVVGVPTDPGFIDFVQRGATTFVPPNPSEFSGGWSLNSNLRDNDAGRSSLSIASLNDNSVFTFYGNTFSHLHMTNHGYFDLGNASIGNNVSGAVLSPATPSALSGVDRIAPMWTRRFNDTDVFTTALYHKNPNNGNQTDIMWYRPYATSSPTSSSQDTTQRLGVLTSLYTDTGRIDFQYLSWNRPYKNLRLVGISSATSTSGVPVDYSTLTLGGTFANASSTEYMYESFSTLDDLSEARKWIVYYPDGMGGMDSIHGGP